MRHAKISLLLAVLLFDGRLLYGSKNKEVPKAPLPPIVQRAKTVFITNAGETPLAYDEFYSEIKKWGRFQLAASPSQADLVLEIEYFVEDKGQHVGSSYNYYTKQTSVYTYDVTDPQLMLNISDPKTNSLIWSTTDHRRLARMTKNREKETIKSADRLVEELKTRIALADQEAKSSSN